MSAFVIGLLGLVASSGRADDQSAFSQLLADQTLRQHILDAAGRSTVMLQNPCPSAQYTLEDKRFVRTAPAFDSSGHIVAGDWLQAVHEQGCDQTRVLNVLLLVQGPNSIATIPLLPGTTHAGPVLQKDAVKYAVQVIAAVPGEMIPIARLGMLKIQNLYPTKAPRCRVVTDRPGGSYGRSCRACRRCRYPCSLFQTPPERPYLLDPTRQSR
jgi:hypothetical protein